MKFKAAVPIDSNLNSYYYKIEDEVGTVHKGDALVLNRNCEGEQGLLLDCMKGSKSHLYCISLKDLEKYSN